MAASRPMSRMGMIEAKENLFRARKRILKYLVLGFLREEGLSRSAEQFRAEAALSDEYELCDNVALDVILQDYCSYYLVRFNKQPQLCKKVERPPSRRPQTRKTRPEPVVLETEDPGPDLPSTFTVTKLLKENILANTDHNIPAMERKPLAGFLSNASPERKEIVDLLYQSIIRPSGVAWDDVKGLDTAKSILMESIVYPVRYPELFTGLLQPWRGVLLHGPPGAGKTMLARAVASESGCVFFNVTCSTLVSKWRGESEKIVKVLFELASYYSPSVVFVDEGEALTASRSRGDCHEASRRLCAQLLAETDGVDQRDGVVFLLFTSNVPWDIDPAILRRLEKRIFIPLPDGGTREQLFRQYLSGVRVCGADWAELARRTGGYSGSDIRLTCKEALMAGVRRTLSMAGKHQNNRIEKISLTDVLEAIEKTKPVSKNLSERHQQWQQKMGST